jgi:membrane protein implicated in regulation of membrane protease activity
MVKNTIKSLIILGFIILWLPTGISDLVFIPLIISKIGFTMYVVISILMVWYLYKTIEGRTFEDKINTIRREIKSFFR